MHDVVAFAVFALTAAALHALRRRLGLFGTSSLLFVATVLYLTLGLDPPAPASMVVGYGAVVLVAIGLYVTSSEDRRRAFVAPNRRVMVERRLRPLLYASLLVIPGLAAYEAFALAMPSSDPPPVVRSVHPSPPSTVQLNSAAGEGRTVDLMREDSPYARLSSAERAERVAHGSEVYYRNCFFCHGDNLSADGHLASALRPPPADFTDPGVIPMLESSFLFWRIAKGGPGLPEAGTPWDSAMPAWERFLSEDDIWSVILFLTDRTGYEPRAKGEVR